MANIAFILNKLPDGGVERVTMNLVEPLALNNGHKIFIFVHELNEERIGSTNIPVTYILTPYPSWSKKNRDVVYETIKRERINILFSPCVSPKYIFDLKRSKMCKVCFVLHSQPLYEITENLNYIKSIKGSWFKSMKRVLLKETKLKLGLYERKFKAKYNKIYTNVDAYGVLFDSYKTELERELGVSPEESKIVTLPNPISPITEITSFADKEKCILFVGRLSRYDKRVDLLLKVWKRIYTKFPEWRLEIVGEGNDKAKLQQYVVEHNLPNVYFKGYTSTPEHYYKRAEILCLTSAFEGLGMVLLEAQQRGCATIAFNCSAGVQDVLSPNWESGVYVPNGDIEAYAEALSRLMSDDELRRKIQRNGPANTLRFSVENSVEKYEALIQKLIQI